MGLQESDSARRLSTCKETSASYSTEMKSSTESSQVGCLPASWGLQKGPPLHLEFLPVAENDSVPVLFTTLLLSSRGFLSPDTTDNGGTLDTAEFYLHSVQDYCYIRPLWRYYLEGRQYHIVASRGQADEH